MQNLSRVVCVLGVALAVGCSLTGRESDQFRTSNGLSLQDDQELRRLYDEDQEDRTPRDPRAIDWSVVGQRDRARRERVKTLLAEGRLVTANDYYYAAMILQHGDGPDDYLLAHELAVASIIKGNTSGAWLAAATEDRFLTSIGRPQRFGTQFKADHDGPWRLEPVDPTMTDELREVFGAPSLEAARAKVVELNSPR